MCALSGRSGRRPPGIAPTEDRLCAPMLGGQSAMQKKKATRCISPRWHVSDPERADVQVGVVGMEVSLSVSDHVRRGVTACPQGVSVWHPPTEPTPPTVACEAVLRSRSFPLPSSVCICVRRKLADGSLAPSRQRVGEQWPWKSTFAWPGNGGPEIKSLRWSYQIVIMSGKDHADFSDSEAPLVARVAGAHLRFRREG